MIMQASQRKSHKIKTEFPDRYLVLELFSHLHCLVSNKKEKPNSYSLANLQENKI